jgi:hypothetical protein
MDMNAIYDVINQVGPAFKQIGEAATVGGLTTLVAATARSLKGGTNIKAQLKDWKNYAAGALVGAVSLVPDVNLTPDNLEQLATYGGAAVSGAVTGGSLKVLKDTINSNESLTQNFQQKFQKGAVKGAITVPIAYVLFQYLTK